MRSPENNISRGQLLHVALQERNDKGAFDDDNFASTHALSHLCLLQVEDYRIGDEGNMLSPQGEQLARTQHAVEANEQQGGDVCA